MKRLVTFRFSTVALIAGAPRYDSQVASIASTLKRASPSLSIVGVAGGAAAQHFSKLYASSSQLDNNHFEVSRVYGTYHEDIQDSIVPYRIYTHLKNYQLIKELEKQNFFNQVYEQKISAVATVGNFSLANRIGEKLNEASRKLGKVRPYTAFFHRQASERTINNEQILDFQYYYVQKNNENSSGYVFPSLCIGYDGLYRAFQHLQQFKQDPTSDSFLSENFSYDISQLVLKARDQFRVARGISQDKYLIYINAGDNADQVKFSFKSYKDGLNAFFAKDDISKISPDHFEILVEIPSDEKLAAEVKGKIGLLPQKSKITLIEQKDKYGALSASDFGLLHNGQVTVEAAGVQLPSLVVDNMSNFHAYFNNLYNGHASPLNIATNFEGYEDLCGSLTAIGEKVSTILHRGFTSPKLRYHYAKLYREQIQKILSKSNTNPQLRVSETGLETGAKHFLEKTASFEKLGSVTFRRLSQRKEAFGL